MTPLDADERAILMRDIREVPDASWDTQYANTMFLRYEATVLDLQAQRDGLYQQLRKIRDCFP